MLDLNPETVCRIIDKAHEFHAKEQVVIPEEPANPSGDWARQVLADHADDPTYRELKSMIEDLEPDQQVSLVALMWLGRGDFDESEWNDALAQARELDRAHRRLPDRDPARRRLPRRGACGARLLLRGVTTTRAARRARAGSPRTTHAP